MSSKSTDKDATKDKWKARLSNAMNHLLERNDQITPISNVVSALNGTMREVPVMVLSN